MTDLTRQQLEKSNICDYNKKILTNFLNSTTQNAANTEKIVRTIDRFLNEQGDLSFSDWDLLKTEELFRWGSWKVAHANTVKKVIFNILKLAGNQLDEKDYVIDDSQRFSKYLLSFKQLQDKIDLTVGILESEISSSSNVVTKYSNVIASLYLSWIGFSVNDIVKIKKEEVDIATKTIRFDGKVYSFYEYQEIADFFEYYITATSYQVICRGTTQERCFVESDLLLKQARAGERIRKNSIVNKAREYAQISLDDVRYSGIMDRLFKIDQSGGDIPMKYTSMLSEQNEEILKVLNINAPNTYSLGSTIASIVTDYPKYRELKIKYIINKS
jgi:hypothetical protein